MNTDSILELLAQNDNIIEVFITGATFSGTVLAIFFTLIALPIENILGRYSQELIKRVSLDRVYWACFVFLGFVLLYNLSLLTFGTVPILSLFSYGFTISSVLTLALLVIHTFYLLDLRNSLGDISKSISKQIGKRVRSSEKKKEEEYEKMSDSLNNPLEEVEGSRLDMKSIYVKSEVGKEVTDWLKESTEPIFDIAQNSSNENRFEIVDYALDEVSNIAKVYIAHRVDYSIEQDAFLLYIHEKLVDLKNNVRQNTHPRIMLSVARTAKNIALASLDTKPVRANRGENFIPLGSINMLNDICLSPEILKETSYAPMSSIDFLVDIAIEAIDKDYPRTASLVTDKLGNIAVTTTKLHFLYADSVAQKANWGLSKVLGHFLQNLDKTSFHTIMEVKSVLGQIDKSINTFMEDDIKHHYTMRNNIKPFFGTLSVNDHGLAGIYIRALQKDYSDRHLTSVIESLEDFLQNINQSVMKGMNNSKYLDAKDILDHIYMIGMTFIWASNRKKSNPGFQIKMTDMLKNRFIYPYVNAISMSFKNDPNRYTIFDDDYMMAFFSLIGLLFYENKGTLYKDILESWITKVLEVIQKYKHETTEKHKGNTFVKHEVTSLLGDLYQYLRLTGVWLNKYFPDSKVLTRVVSEIKIQPDITKKTSSYGQENLYPSYMMERWMIQRPYTAYRPKYFEDADQALLNKEVVEAFEKKLSRKQTSKKRAKIEKGKKSTK